MRTTNSTFSNIHDHYSLNSCDYPGNKCQIWFWERELAALSNVVRISVLEMFIDRTANTLTKPSHRLESASTHVQRFLTRKKTTIHLSHATRDRATKMLNLHLRAKQEYFHQAQRGHEIKALRELHLFTKAT